MFLVPFQESSGVIPGIPGEQGEQEKESGEPMTMNDVFAFEMMLYCRHDGYTSVLLLLRLAQVAWC